MSDGNALDDDQKAEIQQSYSRWLEAHDFKPRYGQRRMIAAVARALAAGADSAQRYCVVEAGTGIGKTVAYTLAAAPVARAQNKTLVISTATVALQEQLINKDLPDLIASAKLPLQFSLAKGRGRYLCLSKLDGYLRNADDQASLPGFYPDEGGAADQGPSMELYREMSEAILRGDWSGDRDDWHDAVAERDWRLLTSDRAQCHNRRCTWVSDCCFFKAREQLAEADCIVTNHDLVLADLALGGGAILPEPEQCLYIFDEAHHLGDKAVQHFSAGIRVNATDRWLQQFAKTVDAVSGHWPQAVRVSTSIDQVRILINTLLLLMQNLPDALHTYHSEISAEADAWRRNPGTAPTARFPLGEVPPELITTAAENAAHFDQLNHHISAIASEMQSCLEAEPNQAELEQWYPLFGAATNRARAAADLFNWYAGAGTEQGTPRAYWVSRSEFDNSTDFGLHSAPLMAANYLSDLLWSRCAGAVLTSATLTALGRFDRLKMHSGIPDTASFEVAPSPFDYASNAVLRVPVQASNPANIEQHTDNVRDYIESLQDTAGVLVLFMSRKQMQEVHEQLTGALLDDVLLQDQRSKQGLLDEHMRRVDADQRSIIFGLASFAEGVDLRGDYCRHVIIAKLPFSVPDDPVASALGEWVESQGRNAFMEVSVPDAALRLVQACGRLLRSEQDSGIVTLLDRRIIEKRYGRDLLDALPPFRREIS